MLPTQTFQLNRLKFTMTWLSFMPLHIDLCLNLAVDFWDPWEWRHCWVLTGSHLLSFPEVHESNSEWSPILGQSHARYFLEVNRDESRGVGSYNNGSKSRAVKRVTAWRKGGMRRGRVVHFHSIRNWRVSLSSNKRSDNDTNNSDGSKQHLLGRVRELFILLSSESWI